MTARLRMSVNAEADLRNILAFSEMRWGKRQRTIYRTLLERTFLALASAPAMGTERPELVQGLRSHPAGSHVIFFLPQDEGILVIRILHNRQDSSLEDW